MLDARAEHLKTALAALYDQLTMPANLLKAHEVLDKAVDAAYGYKGATTNDARGAFLFERYQQIASLLPLVERSKSRVKRSPKKKSSVSRETLLFHLQQTINIVLSFVWLVFHQFYKHAYNR